MQKVELRWKRETHKENDGSSLEIKVIETKTLQMRYCDNALDRWDEWKDIPIVNIEGSEG